MVAAQLMEAETAEEIGARRGEVSSERQTHRNGYRVTWQMDDDHPTAASKPAAIASTE